MDTKDDLAKTKSTTIADTEESRFAKAVKEINKIQDDTVNSIKSANEAFANSEIVDKYGKNSDKLDAMLREFQTAKEALSSCEMISPLEGFAIDLMKIDMSKVLKALGSAEDSLNAGIKAINKQINALIAAGEIPADSLTASRHKLGCSQVASSALNKVDGLVFPPQCADKRSFDKLNLPKIDLMQRLSKLEEQLRDVLCSLGTQLDTELQEAGVDKVINSKLDAVDGADAALAGLAISSVPDKYTPY